MLQEMGVTVWTRAETAAPQAPAAMLPVAVQPCRHRAPASRAAMAQPPAMPVAQPSSAPAAEAHTAPAPAAPAAHAGLGAPGAALRCACTHRSCCTHGGSGTNAARVGRRLAHRDRRHCGRRPSGGDAGKLLDNMLRAMQLHRHPACSWLRWNARTRRPHGRRGRGASRRDRSAGRGGDHLQPALVLVLGHVAARAALGRTEPLGRLRAVPHRGRAPGRGHLRPGLPAAVTETPKPPPGPTCAVHWRWCARPKAAHPTRAEPPGLQRRATSPCNGSLIPADDAAICANASDHRTIAGCDAPLGHPNAACAGSRHWLCSQSGHGYCQLPD